MLKSRKKIVALNTFSSMLLQGITVIVGFILPKLFLDYYGSEMNGLISSITQFLGFITLMELGIGAVVQSALYKPLVSNDEKLVSQIMKSAQNFFNKIAIAYVVYTIVLIIIYPKIDNSFDIRYSGTLILIISISSIAQYFFGLSNQLLLISDQKNYIVNILTMITLILNTLISLILIIKGYDIRTVKLFSMFVLLIKPIFLNIYVKKKYRLDKKIKYVEEPIEQKWNGILQHIASFVLTNTDIMILTVFSNLKNVSIYTIYKLIVSGLQQIVISFMSGIQSAFGHMLANNQITELKKRFSQLELVVHSIVTVIFSSACVLIVPFVQVYTKGIVDAEYNQPFFGIIITLATAMYCLRLPYNVIVLAAGHYRETQNSALIEMVLNIVISIFLVNRFGIVGVSIGTFIAMSYRTIYLSHYLSKNIIFYKFSNFVKHMLINTISVILIIIVTNQVTINNDSYLSWTISAIEVSIISSVIVILLTSIMYWKDIGQIIIKLKKHIFTN